MSKPSDAGAAVEAALKAGYRLIDTAHLYGNEVEIGEAIQRCFKEGVVKREDIFVTSKLWYDLNITTFLNATCTHKNTCIIAMIELRQINMCMQGV